VIAVKMPSGIIVSGLDVDVDAFICRALPGRIAGHRPARFLLGRQSRQHLRHISINGDGKTRHRSNSRVVDAHFDSA
jgi:hypothetical protein